MRRKRTSRRRRQHKMLIKNGRRSICGGLNFCFFEIFARAGRVASDLRGQRVQRGKFPLRTKEAVKPDAERLSVEILLEIQKICFQKRCGEASGGGMEADVDDGREAPPVQLRLRDINAVWRHEHTGCEGEICRREAERMPEVISVRNDAGDQLRMAEKGPRTVQIAALQKLPDDGRADADAVQRHLRHDLAADAPRGAGRLQKLRRTLAAIAEAVIVPADHMLRVELPDKVFLDEGLPRHFHHAAVKVLEDHLVHAVEPAHEERPLLHRAEQRRRRRGKQRGRVRVEAHGRGRTAQPIRRRARPAEQSAVADVYAVKKTERDCA